MPEAEILDTLGGLVIEVDQGQTFRVNEDGLLHFRVRNLTRAPGWLHMRLGVDGARLKTDERHIKIRPEDVHDLRFRVTAERPGEKLVDQLDARFELAGRRHRMGIPDDSLTFRMASATQKSEGSITLTNVSLNIGDIIGDNNRVLDLVRRQDREHKARPDQDWQPLKLMTQPWDGRLVAQPPRKQGMRDLVLLGPTSPRKQEVRVFLFARKELCFGLKSRKGDQKIPLVLRRLPCRSREEDPEAHYANRLISELHGRIGFHEDQLCVRDESRNGTRMGRERLERGVWEPLPRSFRLHLPERGDVLTLSGRTHYPQDEGWGLEVGWPPRSKMGESLDVGAEHVLPVDAVRLRREGNVQDHLYLQVFRSVTIGSGSGCAFKLEAKGICERHAEIVFYHGEWFVRSLCDDGVTQVEGRRVAGEDYVSLAPGKNLTLGRVNFRIRAAKPAHMCHL